MATLTQLTLSADGTLDTTNGQHDAGTGTPWYTHCNDAPNGVSSDYVENAPTETTVSQWFALDDVDADFGSMDTLDIDVDVMAQGFSDDTCTLTARIYDADNDTTNALTAETANLATDADTTRTQRNVSFASLAGSKTQWNSAHIRLTWTYSKSAAPDNATIRLYGLDIDGTYTVGAVKGLGPFTQLSPMGTPGQQYSFLAKTAAGGGSYRIHENYYRQLLAGSSGVTY